MSSCLDYHQLDCGHSYTWEARRDNNEKYTCPVCKDGKVWLILILILAQAEREGFIKELYESEDELENSVVRAPNNGQRTKICFN